MSLSLFFSFFPRQRKRESRRKKASSSRASSCIKVFRGGRRLRRNFPPVGGLAFRSRGKKQEKSPQLAPSTRPANQPSQQPQLVRRRVVAKRFDIFAVSGSGLRQRCTKRDRQVHLQRFSWSYHHHCLSPVLSSGSTKGNRPSEAPSAR